jgi:CDP-glucose 4,6-dehydratase
MTKMPGADFWSGRRVFLTGHTGFKGSWLCLWLHRLGARISGYALAPPTQPNLFELARIAELLHRHQLADVRDGAALAAAMAAAQPEIVIHLAAQPLVRTSYEDPLATYATNVMGSVHLFEAVRSCPSVRGVINVTTDKCYENREWLRGYRENDALGGDDPYSSSKGCSELVTAAYRQSFFNPREYERHQVAVASARAGNVIGGGDWAVDRLVPDILRALSAGEPVRIRHPHAVRPWQHVLEPLCGYLSLARRLHEEGPAFAEAWNFGPAEGDTRPVEWIVQQLSASWGKGAGYTLDSGVHPHEAGYLKLDCSKARQRLGWVPRWNLPVALAATLAWNQGHGAGCDLRQLSLEQIAAYEETKHPGEETA